MRLPGWPEIAVIVLVLLLVFGAARLPQVGSSLGKSMRAFKDAITGQEEDGEAPKSKDKKTKAPASELQEEPQAEVAATARTKEEV